MQLYLPPSITQYSYLWPIGYANAAAMAVLFDFIHAIKPQLSAIVDSKLPDSFITASQASKLAQPDSLVYSAQEWPEPKATELRRFCRNHFPALSYFTNLASSESAQHFSDETVDLIWLQHHDLNHNIISQLIASWQRKTSAAGVLIIHNTHSTSAQPNHEDFQLLQLKELNVDIFYRTHINSNTKELIELFRQENIIEFYKKIGYYWGNVTTVEQQKKAQLNKQLEKRLLAKHG